MGLNGAVVHAGPKHNEKMRRMFFTGLPRYPNTKPEDQPTYDYTEQTLVSHCGELVMPVREHLKKMIEWKDYKPWKHYEPKMCKVVHEGVMAVDKANKKVEEQLDKFEKKLVALQT